MRHVLDRTETPRRHRYLVMQSGPLAMAPSQFGVFAKSSAAAESPDLQVALVVLVVLIVLVLVAAAAAGMLLRMLVLMQIREYACAPVGTLQFHVQPLSLDKFGEPLHSFPGLTASVCNLRPTSRGSGDSTLSRPRAAAGLGGSPTLVLP